MVAQRLRRIGQVSGIVLLRDPRGELVGVVRGQRNHGEDLAGLWVHHDRHALLHAGCLQPPAERVGRNPLHVGVDGQHQVLAWDRRGHGVEQLHRASGSVAFPKLLPVDAAQLSFVARLNAIPTNHIIGQVSLGAQLRELIAGDASRVAENVRQEGAGHSALVVQVLAQGVDLDHDPRHRLLLLPEQQRGVSAESADQRHHVEG